MADDLNSTLATTLAALTTLTTVVSNNGDGSSLGDITTTSTTPSVNCTLVDEVHWIAHPLAWGVAGIFAWLSVFVSCKQIYHHLSYYNNPVEQKWIVRIVLMVPVYGICSWLSLKFYHNSVYFDSVRNVYEALVIYYFLALCYEYLGGESNILANLRDQENKPRCITCTCCLDPFPYNLSFMHVCKRGVLQFCIVKPVMSLISIVAFSQGSFHEGNLDPSEAYIWVAIAYNLSIAVALFSLMLFYAATATMLKPHRPVLKFFIIKAVIFFAFWQAMVLSFGEKLGYVEATCQISAEDIAMCYQNFLICLEMFLASIGMYYGFTHKVYMKLEGMDEVNRTGGVVRALGKAISPMDMVEDSVRSFSTKYKRYIKQGLDDDGEELDEPDEADEESEIGGDITSLSTAMMTAPSVNASAGGGGSVGPGFSSEARPRAPSGGSSPFGAPSPSFGEEGAADPFGPSASVGPGFGDMAGDITSATGPAGPTESVGPGFSEPASAATSSA